MKVDYEKVAEISKTLHWCWHCRSKTKIIVRGGKNDWKIPSFYVYCPCCHAHGPLSSTPEIAAEHHKTVWILRGMEAFECPHIKECEKRDIVTNQCIEFGWQCQWMIEDECR